MDDSIILCMSKIIEQLQIMNENLECVACAIQDINEKKSAPDSAATPSQGNETR